MHSLVRAVENFGGDGHGRPDPSLSRDDLDSCSAIGREIPRPRQAPSIAASMSSFDVPSGNAGRSRSSNASELVSGSIEPVAAICLPIASQPASPVSTATVPGTSGAAAPRPMTSESSSSAHCSAAAEQLGSAWATSRSRRSWACRLDVGGGHRRRRSVRFEPVAVAEQPQPEVASPPPRHSATRRTRRLRSTRARRSDDA